MVISTFVYKDKISLDPCCAMELSLFSSSSSTLMVSSSSSATLILSILDEVEVMLLDSGLSCFVGGDEVIIVVVVDIGGKTDGD